MSNETAQLSEDKPRPRIGVYWVDKGWLNISQAHAVLIEQEKQQHSSLEIACAVTGMDKHDAVLYSQEANVCEIPLFQLLEQKGELTDITAAELDAKQYASRPSFGEMTVKMGLASKDDVDYWLVDYFAFVTGNPVPEPQPKENAKEEKQLVSTQPNQVPSKPSKSTAAANRTGIENTLENSKLETVAVEKPPVFEFTLPVTAPLDCEETLLHDYIQGFNDDFRQHLDSKLMEVEHAGSEERKALLTEIYRDMHSLKGSSGFVGAMASQVLLHKMEDALSLLQTHTEVFSDDEIIGAVDYALKGLDLLWSLSESIADYQDETPFMQNTAEEYTTYIQSLLQYMHELAIKVREKNADIDIGDMF